jgi:hypothetical protein
MKTVQIKISPVEGTTIAESKDEARWVRQEKILPALNRGDRVQIDFGAVGFTTQSFIHALLSEPIRTFGERTFDQVTFAHCTREVKEVILTVFEYTMAAAEVATDAKSAADAEVL